jgi:hypothetical protein
MIDHHHREPAALAPRSSAKTPFVPGLPAQLEALS